MNRKILNIFVFLIVFITLFIITFFVFSKLLNNKKENKQDIFVHEVLNDFLTRSTIDRIKITNLVVYYNDDNMLLEIIYDFTSSVGNYHANLLAIYDYERGSSCIAGGGDTELVNELKIFKSNQFVKQKVYSQDFINKIIKEKKLEWANE